MKVASIRRHVTGGRIADQERHFLSKGPWKADAGKGCDVTSRLPQTYSSQVIIIANQLAPKYHIDIPISAQARVLERRLL